MLLVLLKLLELNDSQLHSIAAITIGFGSRNESDSLKSLVLYQYRPQCCRYVEHVLTTLRFGADYIAE